MLDWESSITVQNRKTLNEMLLVFCNFKIIWSLNDLIIGRHGRDKQFYKALQLLLEFFSSNSVVYLYLKYLSPVGSTIKLFGS
jgi:hypothetical protein